MLGRLFSLLVIILISCHLAACDKIAVATRPAKHPVASNTPLAQQAEQTFWTTFHQGQYDQIPLVLRLLTAAYLENPNDPNLAAHLGFTHLWVIAERQRQTKLDPLIVNQVIVSKKYFADAMELAPQDARFIGFYGDTQLIEGQIFGDQREQARGYFTLQKAIHAWPQFNYFTAGYPMSSLPASDKMFKKGLSWQWKTLDICAHEKVDRNNPDYSKYMHLQTEEGPDRACWNSWIAPHNFEGFFLNMGDMLVKQGDWQTAIKIYNNAKLSSTYADWPYRDVLEARIAHAQENVAKFNQPTDLTQVPPIPSVMFNSKFSCMGCHQQ